MTRTQHRLNLWILAALVLVVIALALPANAQNVAPKQKEQLKSLALQTRRDSEAARAGIRRARIALVAAYSNYKLNERTVRLACSTIDVAQRSLLSTHLDNQIGIRRILNPDQFRRFLEMTRKGREPNIDVMPPPEDALMDRLPDRQMLSGLGMTSEQSKRAPQLIGPSAEKKKVIDKLRRDSKRMLDLYSDYNLDVAAARRLIDAIHASQTQLSEINHRKQQLIRSVLTESQFQQLQDEIVRRIKEHRSKRARPG